MLKYLDYSIGETVAEIKTKSAEITSMTDIKTNGVIVTGHSNGCVNLYTPNYASTEILKILAHPNSVTDVAIDPKGQYMVTAGVDSRLRVWDLRNTHKQIHDYFTPKIATKIAISQKGILAVGNKSNFIEIWKDFALTSKQQKPYMKHHFKDNKTTTNSLKFINYEDYLGVGTNFGYEQLVIPGAGEANFDTFEHNPFETKKQKSNNEVNHLLEKIPYTMINMNANEKVNTIDKRSKSVIERETKEEMKAKADEIMKNQKKKLKKRLKNKEKHDEILKEIDKTQKVRNKMRAIIESNHDKLTNEKSTVKNHIKVIDHIDDEFDPELYLNDDNIDKNDDNDNDNEFSNDEDDDGFKSGFSDDE